MERDRRLLRRPTKVAAGSHLLCPGKLLVSKLFILLAKKCQHNTFIFLHDMPKICLFDSNMEDIGHIFISILSPDLSGIC